MKSFPLQVSESYFCQAPDERTLTFLVLFFLRRAYVSTHECAYFESLVVIQRRAFTVGQKGRKEKCLRPLFGDEMRATPQVPTIQTGNHSRYALRGENGFRRLQITSSDLVGQAKCLISVKGLSILVWTPQFGKRHFACPADFMLFSLCMNWLHRKLLMRT